MFSFCAIDFETTGDVPGYPNEPWQIGCVAVPEGGRVADAVRFESYLRVAADRPFNRWAPGRHSKIRSELAVSPTLVEVLPELDGMLSGPLVAHNASTERKMLGEALPLHRPGPWIDTLALSRIAWPDAESHALEDLIPSLGLGDALAAMCPGRAPHDALYDALACALLLETLLSSSSAWGRSSPAELSRMRPAPRK